MEFHQHAKGEFQVDVIEGTPHCGVQSGRAHLAFEIFLDYTAHPLNHDGFLLDNTDFQYYFQSLAPVGYSCERVAQHAAEHFLKDARVAKVRVRIFPFGETYVEAVLYAGSQESDDRVL